MIEEIRRGQLSTFILMTLVDKDKYGYEIIDEVLQTTNGKISIKQPSLYSSLKRMEQQS
ncbi:MAG: PadR family transcriptional regulator, partial [Clostridiales bacterium]|nr:PadR family transcriptional regulator [Clostridiales bacterium]